MPDAISQILRFVDGWGRRAYPVRWSLRDTITYAIATGADARNARAFVWESAPDFGPLPTFATRFAHDALIDFAAGTQHAGLSSFARATRVRLHRPLPAECDRARAVTALSVKERSPGRLVLTLDVETCAAGETIAHSSLDVHFRVAHGRSTRPPSSGTGDTEGGGRTVEVRESVRPYQAAVFRTLLGLTADGRVQDAMHIDPVRARELGLSAPALPGEVTLGIVARLAAQNLRRLGVGGLVAAEMSYLSPVSDVDRLTIAFAPSRGGSVRTKVVNGKGRVAARGALHFRTGPTTSDRGETS
ncbi:MaoC like domain-containing protein [Thermomonospora echinospora]|uniref:MaoC like domain-containing protein n=1 Tax=Thermomonospora echinospora TaxID=1992 RepID=A0A1H6E5K5_9ACTN|nr:MaoC/PaaZ C-terminal domain-containing protein [Thermomonospora echinospora]SEG92980.1 MaoC like domain-containing protein [Thermomonospora echinospora]